MTKSESSGTFRVKCPTCTKTIRVQESMRGRHAKCPRCGGEFKIPCRGSAKPTRKEPRRQSLAIANEPPIPPGSKQADAIQRNILIAAWTVVGLFAVSSLVLCIWYARSQHAANVAAADLRVSQAVADAQQWMADEEDLAKWKIIETSLIGALSHESVSDKHMGQTVLELFRQHAQAARKWDEARQLLKQGNGRRAALVLEEYLGLELAKNKAEAKWMLEELKVANSDEEALTTLLELDEASFLEAKRTGKISEPRVTRPELKDIFNGTVKRNLPIAEKKRQAEHARLAAEAEERERLLILQQKEAEQQLNADRKRREEDDVKLRGIVENPTELETFLHAGKFTVGLVDLQTQLLNASNNDNLRFQLGLTQFFNSIERLGQSLHRFGVKQALDEFPFLRLPVPENLKPDPINYVQFRRILDDLIRDLDSVDSTLALIQADDVAVSLRLGVIRFDMDGDGNADQELTAILKQLHQEEFAFLQGNETLPVDFDRGDVTWLRIYCQLMAAVLDFALAFDLEPGFDQHARDVFDNPQVGKRSWDSERVFRVVEPRRLARVRHRLILITELNHEMWKQIRAETDNGLEWLPNSSQQSVLGFTVSDPLVDSWLAAMTEVGAALRGERVIEKWLWPWLFQRTGKGLNLKLLLEDPPEAILRDFPSLCLVRKHFSVGVPFDLNTLEKVYRNYEKWLD